MIPSYLRGFVKETDSEEKVIISASDGNDVLEVWYYGDLMTIGHTEYIVDSEDAPMKIVARNPADGEEILIFDGAKCGYDNLFCNEYSKEAIEKRALKKYSIPPSKLIAFFGYEIDYEEEKDNYDFDDLGNVILIDGSSMSWEDVKANGYDWFSLSYINARGRKVEIADCELA